MNTAFNSALKQSTSIRKDFSALSPSSSSDAAAGGGPAALTPAALGSLSASLTSFSRTLDEYNRLAKQELNPTKQEKAFSRLSGFRTELAEYRAQLESIKTSRDDAIHDQNRGELLGRRPYVSATPENPYANTASSSSSSGATSYGGGGAGLSMGSGNPTAEEHALREQDFFSSTNRSLDDYIAQGQAVLDNLGMQKDMLKNTQKRLYSAANTLGLSGETIRMIERRAREDKWIFWAGVIVFFLFCWLCLHFLR
ncbi:uncharacterized protein E0L32_004587 [Thyridium curvatum]|uniref:Protein transport protein BOS1 n=1 Tax=Thyridium curvatum TaxID=1093900 RepID=A0A507BFI6_9PEZI|nr:uncharacterized protein E0L32_004587 [Thyridium curvatum]TPX15310.1 hypothetical protein E0L32_004587 [Thyridium curvatum]